MKRIKSLIVIGSLMLSTFGFISSVNAHEYSPPYRFIDVVQYQSVKQVNFKMFGGMLSSTYSTAWTNAMSNWTYNSGYRVNVVSGPYSFPESRVNIWDHVWNWGSQYAVTAAYVTNGKCDKAQIYMNVNTTGSWSLTDKEANVAHEMGHVMGLQHALSPTKSIMRQGRASTDFNWWWHQNPQDHDRTDLASFYP